MKFKPLLVDKVHRNYFIYNLFEPNSNRHHKNFRALFACPNHLIKHTTLKIDGASYSYVDGIYIYIYLDAWCCIFNRWNHHKFQRSPGEEKNDDVKIKGYGFHKYDFFQKGYTHQIFMCNDTWPKTDLSKRMLPQHIHFGCYGEYTPINSSSPLT